MLHFLILILLAVNSYAATPIADTPLPKSKEEALVAIRAFHASHQKNHGPYKAFMEREETRRNLPKLFSKSLKNVVLRELAGNGDNAMKEGMKGKIGRFLFNHKKNSLLNKMRKDTKKDNDVNSRRTKQLRNILTWIKEPALAARTEEVSRKMAHNDTYYDDDDYFFYGPENIFEMFDYLTMSVAYIDHSQYSGIVDAVFWLFGGPGNVTLPSPEEFCAEFNVTTTEDECVDAVTAFVTLVEGAIRAPWLLGDILGYVKTVIREIISWETVQGLATGIMSIYGADGTIDGALNAIKDIVTDGTAFVYTMDPELSSYVDTFDSMFDAYPMLIVYGMVMWDYNMMEDMFFTLYGIVNYMVPELQYIFGEELIEVPEIDEFHADVCEVLGLVPGNITAVMSCDYFEVIGLEDIEAENIEFCVEANMEDYTAEMFAIESTLDTNELGHIIEGLQSENWKFGYYNFSMMESMTCSIKGRLQAPNLLPMCGEKPSNTFLFKRGTEKNCRWLRNREKSQKESICERFPSANLACPSTCCLCEEDPKEEFFVDYARVGRSWVSETENCSWLSEKEPHEREEYCKKSFAPDDLKVASGACPTTCGLCDGKNDKCQEGIDVYIDSTSSIVHYDVTTRVAVYVNNFGGGVYSSMAAWVENSGNWTSYDMGYFYERDGNTFLYGGGEECGDGNVLSKVVLVATEDLESPETFVSQTSECTYEFKVIIPCDFDGSDGEP